MAVTQQQPVLIAADFWRISWSSDLQSPLYLVYFGGRLVYSGVLTSLNVRSTVVPYVEILDDPAAQSQQSIHPPFMRLSWHASSNTAYYSVRRVVASVETEVDRVTDTGRTYYIWDSPPLDDGDVVTYRVVPVSIAGVAGASVDFAAEIVRHPDTPEISLDYDSGTGQVVVDNV